MQKKNIGLILLISFLISCDNVENRTVIDGIILGGTIESTVGKTESQTESLGLIEEPFLINAISDFTNQSLDEAITKNCILLRYSKSLSLITYKEPTIAILLPTVYLNTENVCVLDVILARPINPIFIFGATPEFLRMNLKSFQQFFIREYLDDIENILIERYGKPKSKITDENPAFYVPQDGKFIYANLDLKVVKVEAEIVEWETKDMTITFNKGCITNHRVYILKSEFKKFSNGYAEYRDMNHKITDNEEITFSYPFIEYRLKDKTIERLKLDKTDIKL